MDDLWIIYGYGWWLTHPSEKYESQLGWWFLIIIWENKKWSKPPTSSGLNNSKQFRHWSQEINSGETIAKPTRSWPAKPIQFIELELFYQCNWCMSRVCMVFFPGKTLHIFQGQCDVIWLVVSPPLKNISQLGWLFPTEWKNKTYSKPPICDSYTSLNISKSFCYFPEQVQLDSTSFPNTHRCSSAMICTSPRWAKSIKKPGGTLPENHNGYTPIDHG